MFGVKTRIPNGDFAAAARDGEACLTVLAGDNVVRLLPPLIVDESDIARGGVRAFSTAPARASPRPLKQMGAA